MAGYIFASYGAVADGVAQADSRRGISSKLKNIYDAIKTSLQIDIVPSLYCSTAVEPDEKSWYG